MCFDRSKAAMRRKDDLSLAEKMVLLVLADMADDRGHCWPCYALICERGKIVRSCAIKCVKSLVAKGLLLKEKRLSNGGNTSNCYTITPLVFQGSSSEGKGDRNALTSGETSESSQSPGESSPSTQKKSVKKSVNKSLKDPFVVSGETPTDEVVKPKPTTAKLPPFDRQKVVDAWNQKAEQYGLPKIRAVSISLEKGLLRLWKSYIHLCRELGRESVSAEKLFVGYITQGYTPTPFACGDNPLNKKYGIDTALRQERIDQILQEVIGE